MLGAIALKLGTQRAAGALDALHRLEPADLRVIDQVGDDLLEVGGSGQRSRAGLIHLPLEQPLGLTPTFSVTRFLTRLAIADRVLDLPESRARALVDRTACALETQRAKLGEVALNASRMGAGGKVKIVGRALRRFRLLYRLESQARRRRGREDQP